MKVAKAMTGPAQTVDVSTSLVDAARLMQELDIGFLAVTEETELVGTVTDRDIVCRAVALGQDVRDATVRSVMTPGLVYCYEDDELGAAAALMVEKQIQRLVVIDRENRLVGVVSLGDLASWSEDKALVGEAEARIAEDR